MKAAKSIAIATALTTSTTCFAGGPAFSGLFAKASNAETVYNNPAGMARLDGTQMTGQGIAIVSFGEFEVDDDLTTVDGGNPRTSDPSFIPAFYYSQEVHDDWRLGFSINIPSGFGSDNGPNWSGRYYSDQFSLVYVAFSPAAAYKVTEVFLSARVSVLSTRPLLPKPRLITGQHQMERSRSNPMVLAMAFH